MNGVAYVLHPEPGVIELDHSKSITKQLQQLGHVETQDEERGAMREVEDHFSNSSGLSHDLRSLGGDLFDTAALSGQALHLVNLVSHGEAPLARSLMPPPEQPSKRVLEPTLSNPEGIDPHPVKTEDAVSSTGKALKKARTPATPLDAVRNELKELRESATKDLFTGTANIAKPLLKLYSQYPSSTDEAATTAANRYLVIRTVVMGTKGPSVQDLNYPGIVEKLRSLKADVNEARSLKDTIGSAMVAAKKFVLKEGEATRQLKQKESAIRLKAIRPYVEHGLMAPLVNALAISQDLLTAINQGADAPADSFGHSTCQPWPEQAQYWDIPRKFKGRDLQEVADGFGEFQRNPDIVAQYREALSQHAATTPLGSRIIEMGFLDNVSLT